MNSETTAPIWTTHAARRVLERSLDPAQVQSIAADAIRAGMQGQIRRCGLVVVVRGTVIVTCARECKRWRQTRAGRNRRLKRRRRRRAG